MSHPCRHVFIASNSLWQAVNVVAIYLDMDSEWWETWGCKFELGILDWIKSRPRMIWFDMKTLNNSLQAQIQALLLDQRIRRRIRRSRRWQQPCSFSALLASEIAWQTSKSWLPMARLQTEMILLQFEMYQNGEHFLEQPDFTILEGIM